MSTAGGPVKRAGVVSAGRMSLNTSAKGSSTMMRTSMAPQGRASLAAPRHSLAASANGRKSSVGVRRGSAYGAGSGKADPRPITDKGYVNDSIRALVGYLSDYGYDQPISAKILTRPSGRDFNNIMGFLFRQYDPAWQPTPGSRFEEEVIPFLKAIGYPFTLSKASLLAVGAPQTWPKALAAISWMIELLAYDRELANHEADQQDRRAAGDCDGIADHALDDKVSCVTSLVVAYASITAFVLSSTPLLATALSRKMFASLDRALAYVH
jgi:SMC interacting uncharacterized protein involved in chromosome segregation